MTNLTTDLEAVMDALAMVQISPLLSGVNHHQDAAGRRAHEATAAHAKTLAVNFLRNYGDAIRDIQGERDNLRQIVIEAGIAAEAYHVAANKCVRGDEIVHDRSLTEAANAFHAKMYHLRKFAAALNPKGEAQ